jgi:hypothetical protein
VGVVTGVHYRTANGRSSTEVAGLTSLTKLHSFVLYVTNLTDGCLAFQTYDAYFTGRKTYLSNTVVLSHQLSLSTSGTNQLCALTRIQFDVVNHSTNGDCGERQSVTRLNVCICTRVYGRTSGEAYRSNDVALLAFGILKERDVCASVRIVFNTQNFCRSSALTLEVDDTILDLVTTAVMTNGDAAIAVTARVLLLSND